jgi:ABC-type spermidine/putrescine transport system permease subunit I
MIDNFGSTWKNKERVAAQRTQMVDHVIDVIMVGITLVLSQAVSVFVSAKCLSVSKHMMLYICMGQNSRWRVNWVWCSIVSSLLLFIFVFLDAFILLFGDLFISLGHARLG